MRRHHPLSRVGPDTKPGDRLDPIHVRQVRPGDAPAIAEFFCHLSPETVYYRYFTASRPSVEAACRLANCDHRTTEAIVAETAGGSVVGVIECYRHGEHCAEMGIVIDDDYQSRGVGSRLLRAAVGLLEAEGIVQLDGDILPENHRMRGWMRDLGAKLRFDHGSLHFSLFLQPEEHLLPRAA